MSEQKENLEQFELVEMKYYEYKNYYNNFKTKKDSYNKETKTIKVYIKKGEEVIKQTLNELTEKLENELINEAKKAGFDNETSIKFKNAYFNQLEKVGYERIDICNVLHSVDNEKRKEINKLSELYYKKAKQVNWI